MQLRKKFISLTASFSPVLPLGVLSGITGRRFILPFYHIVSDEDCPHIKRLYRFKKIKEFESDLDYLLSNYLPVGADDLENVLAGKYKGKNIMLLSFDDGLRQMREVVAPILLQKGVPAVFFLNTNFIDNKELMFRYKVSLLLEQVRGDVVKATKLQSVRSDEELRKLFLTGQDNLSTDFLTTYKPYMTGADIKWLLKNGFVIGAHSCSHPYYEDINLEEQLRETLDSLSAIQADFGVKQRLFAFPFTDSGVSLRFFDHIFQGGLVDFSFGSAGIKDDVHPRQMQRIPMEGFAAGAEQILKSEYLYYLLRMPLRRNAITRK